jgi:hypothetical protein
VAYNITPANNTFSNTCPLLVNYEASNTIVPATPTNRVASVYVARPPVKNFAGINLTSADAARPLQNCRFYYSQIQMEEIAIDVKTGMTDFGGCWACWS